MPRKKQYKIEAKVDITPCMFKHEEEWTCLCSESELFGFVPSNSYCEKCPFREEYNNDDKRFRK